MLEIYRFNSFTTNCEVQLYGQDKSKLDSCAKDILKDVKRLEKKYNYYDINSYLSQINNRKTNIVDSETKSILQRAIGYYNKTDGIFDITIATVKDIYTKYDKIDTINSQVDTLKDFMGCEHIKVKKDKISFDNIYTKIDFGGFVKEYSVDRAINIIKKYKIKSALVNFGGDIFALGSKPNGDRYNISIVNPLDKTKVLFNIAIENQALTTSASYERYINIEGNNISHIISKYIKNSDIISATVVSNSCVDSGVYSTSLMIDSKIKINKNIYLIDKELNIIDNLT
jgi:thiamine biosynthesis lipoprotein